jgi:Cdc6-like AAA superfamily ATPase
LKEIETISRLLSLEVRLIIVSESYETYRRLNSMGKANITNIIEIHGYNEEQAFDILLERAREALEGTAYSEDTIKDNSDKLWKHDSGLEFTKSYGSES